MSSARITYIGLTGYPMIHPVINRINPNSVKFRMDDWISGLIEFGAHLYLVILQQKKTIRARVMMRFCLSNLLRCYGK